MFVWRRDMTAVFLSKTPNKHNDMRTISLKAAGGPSISALFRSAISLIERYRTQLSIFFALLSYLGVLAGSETLTFSAALATLLSLHPSDRKGGEA